jgi:hypothetical protein
MSCSQPTGDRASVPLELPDSQAKILRDTLGICLDGVRGDLKAPESMPNPEQAGREASAYERLLAALDRGSITIPDQEAHEAFEVIVLSFEEDHDYLRLAAEHDALSRLLDLLGGVKAEAR